MIRSSDHLAGKISLQEVACQEVLAGQVGVSLFALQHAPGEDVLFPAHSPPERPGQRSSGQVPLSDRRHS